MIDFLKWLLQVDIRWKNGLSALAALLSVSSFYILARHSDWFREVAAHGDSAILVALGIVLLISFLTIWLILSGTVGIVMHRHSAKEAVLAEIDKLKRIGHTLGSTTNWQRSFLLRFIDENTMQIKEWEVGEYKAVWGTEVEVLCAKGIIKRHHAGVLEIVTDYWQYLQAFWDPTTQTLKTPEELIGIKSKAKQKV